MLTLVGYLTLTVLGILRNVLLTFLGLVAEIIPFDILIETLFPQSQLATDSVP